jgi:biopolymer transport protein ExbD
VSTTPFAALFLTLIAIAVGFHNPTGFVVRIAQATPCRYDDRPFEVVQVLSHGGLRINSRDLKRVDLASSLDEIFRTRAPRHFIFLTADPNLPFAEVAQVIDSVAKHVDYIAILTPSVSATNWRNGLCIDPNLPKSNIESLPR